jgi:hypothetical protein
MKGRSDAALFLCLPVRSPASRQAIYRFIAMNV